MDYKSESIYRLSKKTTTTTMTTYTNSGLVYTLIFASIEHNEPRKIQLFHLFLIQRRFRVGLRTSQNSQCRLRRHF